MGRSIVALSFWENSRAEISTTQFLLPNRETGRGQDFKPIFLQVTCQRKITTITNSTWQIVTVTEKLASISHLGNCIYCRNPKPRPTIKQWKRPISILAENALFSHEPHVPTIWHRISNCEAQLHIFRKILLSKDGSKAKISLKAIICSAHVLLENLPQNLLILISCSLFNVFKGIIYVFVT